MEEETKLLKTRETLNGFIINGVSKKATTEDGTLEDIKTDKDTVLYCSREEPSRSRMAVTLAACSFSQFIQGGTNVALGVIYVEFIAYFDSSRSHAALVQSVFVGLAIGGGIFFSRLVLKYEAGLVVVVSSFVSAASFCSSAFAPNIAVAILLIGIVSGLATGINILVGYVVVSWMFQKRRNAALSTVLVGSACGQIVMPYITKLLIDQFTWKGAIAIIGSLMYLNAIPCGLVIYFSRHYFKKGDTAKINRSRLVDVECLTDTAFMIYLVSLICFFAFTSIEASFIVDMVVSKGMPKKSGVTLLSVNGIMLGVSRIIGMVWLGMAPDTRLEWHLIYMFLGWAVSRIIISQSDVLWAMMLGIIIRGLASGLVYGCNGGVLINMRGLELFPQTLAITNCLGGTASVLGGFLGGLSFDITRSYSFVFLVGAGFNVFNALAMVLILIVYRYRRAKATGYEKLQEGTDDIPLLEKPTMQSNVNGS